MWYLFSLVQGEKILNLSQYVRDPESKGTMFSTRRLPGGSRKTSDCLNLLSTDSVDRPDSPTQYTPLLPLSSVRFVPVNVSLLTKVKGTTRECGCPGLFRGRKPDTGRKSFSNHHRTLLSLSSNCLTDDLRTRPIRVSTPYNVHSPSARTVSPSRLGTGHTSSTSFVPFSLLLHL